MSDGNTVKGLFVKIGGDTTELKEALEQGKEALSEFGINVDKIKNFLTGGGGLALALSSVAKESLEAATQFEEAGQIIGRSTGVIGEGLTSLQDSLKNVLASGVEQSFTEIGEALAQINIRFNATGETLEELTKKFADYADVNRVDLVSSINDVSKIINKFKLDTSDTGLVLDKITLASQKTGKSVKDFTSELVSNGAVLQGANLTLNDSISLLAGFEKGGVDSARAFAGIKTALQSFQKDGLDAGAALKELIEQIKNARDPADAAALAANNFGKGAQDLLQAIRGGYVDLQAFNGLLSEASGTLEKTSEATKTTEEVANELKNQLLALGAEGFGGILQIVKPFLQVFQQVLVLFSQLPAPVRTTIETVGVLVTALKLAEVAAALFGRSLTFSLGPIALVATAVIGLVQAFNYLADAKEREARADREQINNIAQLNAQAQTILGPVTKLTENRKLDAEQIAKLAELYPDLTAKMQTNITTTKEAAEAIRKKNIEDANNILWEQLRRQAEAYKELAIAEQKAADAKETLERTGRAGQAEQVFGVNKLREEYQQYSEEVEKTRRTIEALTASTKENTKANEAQEVQLKSLTDLSKAIRVINEEVNQGLIKEQDALEQKIALRNSVIDTLLKEAQTTGTLKEAQKQAILELNALNDENQLTLDNLTSSHERLSEASHEQYYQAAQAAEYSESVQELALRKLVDAQKAATKTIDQSWQQSADILKTVTGALASNVFTPMGEALAKGALSWQDFGKGVIHSLGDIVKAIGDFLAAEAAKNLYLGLAAAATAPLPSSLAAPGYFTASAIDTAGASIAYITSGFLKAYATGTDSAAGGLSLVGEQGMELANLPAGTEVTPSFKTEELFDLLKSNAGTPIQLTVQLGPDEIYRQLFQATRNRKLLISSKGVVNE